MEPIKLLQFGKFFPPDRGGIETVTKTIGDMLIEHHIRADALVVGRAEDAIHDCALPYRVLRCPAGIRRGNKALSPAYLAAIRRLQPDYDLALVHLPNPLAVAGALAFWRKPMLLLWHADTPQPMIRRLGAPFERRLARRAFAVIGPTPVHLAASHIADALQPKGVVIPLPHEMQPAGRSEDVPSDITVFVGGRRLILAVGRLVPYKGFDRLIAAAGRLTHDAAIVIVGEGPEQAALAAAIASAGLGRRVMLAGGLSEAALAGLRRQAWIGCMPSISAAEMYGLAQVEMMAAGVPVVATDPPGSGVAWVNRHGTSGLIVPPDDPSALAAALDALIADPALRARLGFGAVSLFSGDYGRDAVSVRYAGLIRGALGLG